MNAPFPRNLRGWAIGLAMGTTILVLIGLGLWRPEKTPSRPVSYVTPLFLSTRTQQGATSIAMDELKQRWLSGTPCPPPCWEGIVPGKTSAAEAVQRLSANPVFTKVEMAKSPLAFDKEGFVTFEWITRGRAVAWAGDALFDSTSSDQIIYLIRVPFPKSRLEEFIAAFGPPSHALTYKTEPSDIGGPVTWQVNVLWLSQGLMLRTDSFSELRVDPNLELGEALYFAPTLEGYAAGFKQAFPEWAKRWQGYDKFEAYSKPTPISSP